MGVTSLTSSHLLHQPPQPGRRHRRRSIARLDTEFFKRMLDVLFDRRVAGANNVANGAVGYSFGHPVQHLGFAGGDVEPRSGS